MHRLFIIFFLFYLIASKGAKPQTEFDLFLIFASNPSVLKIDYLFKVVCLKQRK